jgi:hypothetical protein
MRQDAVGDVREVVADRENARIDCGDIGAQAQVA